MKLIDKAAVVAWVAEKREAALYRQHNLERIGQETYVNQMIADNLGRMLSFLDTLEVKEVDIDSEIDLWVKNLHSVPNFEELNKFAHHFFELGMQISNKAEKEVGEEHYPYIMGKTGKFTTTTK